MKQKIFALFCITPLIGMAQSETLELEQIPVDPLPKKKTYSPPPSLLIIDRQEIQIQSVFSPNTSRLVIKTGQSEVVYENEGVMNYYLPQPLSEDEIYTIYLYVDNRLFSGTYIPE